VTSPISKPHLQPGTTSGTGAPRVTLAPHHVVVHGAAAVEALVGVALADVRAV